MNYKQAQKEYKLSRVKKSLWLMKLGKFLLDIVLFLNKLDTFNKRLIAVLLGFQYDIYVKLYELSYNREYLEKADKIADTVSNTLSTIGE